MTAPQFVDISAFQPINVDWVAYRKWSASFDGVSRVAMRSSYGVGYTDQHYAGYRAGALAAGIDVILYYHYAYPQYNSRPTDEANWQRKVVGDIRPQDMIILDYEENVDMASSGWAYAFLAQQEANYGGKLPGIYASSSYIQSRLQDPRLAKYPLWLANWQYTPEERPDIPAPWARYRYVQYTDRAMSVPGIPGTVDANIYFGGNDVNNPIYGPGRGDFDQYFTVSNGNWISKRFNTILAGGNLALYQKLSMDGNTLPILGIPRTNEIYQHDSDGYAWSVQFFERGVIVYDPAHRRDSQPGLGSSYLGKYLQFQHLDPDATTVEAIPASLRADIEALPSLVHTAKSAFDDAYAKLCMDAGIK